MRIVRYQVGASEPEYGILEGEEVLATSGRPFTDLQKTERVGGLGQVTLLAPVEPKTIMCVGRNYRAHAEEFGNEVPSAPILFMKPPSSVVGPGAEVLYPQASQRVDPEAELVIVIGKPAFQVPAAEAYSVIGGYTCGNDVTARDIQKSDPGGQWTRGKGFHTFCPIGPWVETDYDPSDVLVECTVDGGRRQSGRTSAFIFDIPFLIEYVTSFMQLEPGDVIMTGTPEGVAPVEPGNEMTVRVEGLGELTNRLVAPGE